MSNVPDHGLSLDPSVEWGDPLQDSMGLSFWLASESPQGPLRLGGILNLHKDFVSVEWARAGPSYKKLILLCNRSDGNNN
jgi:hypothetical protein